MSTNTFILFNLFYNPKNYEFLSFYVDFDTTTSTDYFLDGQTSDYLIDTFSEMLKTFKHESHIN